MNLKSALAALFLMPVLAAPAGAAAPLAHTAAPGYFRMMVGDFEVTALNDGTLLLPADKLLAGISPEMVGKAFAKDHLPIPVETSFNGYLVNTGSKLILIDTGAGALFGKTLGKLAANLEASGYKPEQVDEIYVTHLHPDHVGGITADGKRVFPNATLRADKAESDYWLNEANAAKAPEEHKDFFPMAKAALQPWIEAGRYKPFEGAAELTPGITARPTHGHTPGHESYLVQSKGETLVVVGDLIHFGAVQFPDPTITIFFDSDRKMALAQRQTIFADAAKRGWLVAAAHISFPGLGYLEAQGKGYRWRPVNFTQLNN